MLGVDAELALGPHPEAVAAAMVPGHVYPAVMELPGDGAHAPGAGGVVLVPPLPVNAPDQSGPRHNVLHYVGPQHPPGLSHGSLRLLGCIAQLVTDPGHVTFP